MRSRLLLGFLVGAASALTWFVACSNTTFESESDSGVAESGADDSAVAEAGCPNSDGSTMVHITSPSFCVDATEVTNAQYQNFLDAIANGYQPEDAGDAGACSWNTTYNPSASTNCVAATDPQPNQPVTCIDWCDAHAFCAWAGKHLCGAILASSAPLDITEGLTPSTSQWELACSAAGTRIYPYGNPFDASACNTPALMDGGALSDVMSFPNCVGGYPGIFDMAGNAAEWIDACEDGGNAGSQFDNCADLGDSYLDSRDEKPGACATRNYFPRNATNPDVGFRCCAE